MVVSGVRSPSDRENNAQALRDSTVYKSGVYFQFEAQLYHVGLLTGDSTDDANAALADNWQLEHSVRPAIQQT